MGKPTCAFSECNRARYGKKVYCKVHHTQHRDGKPLAPIRERNQSAETLLAKYSTKNGPPVPGHPEMGNCWLWEGCQSPSSGGHKYGVLRYQGKGKKAHRLSWEIHNGPIPDGIQVDHACHNRLCVNPTHLRLATHNQNVAYLRGAKGSNKSSGVRNVYRNGNGWIVKVRSETFGTYPTIEEAAKVATKVRAEIFDFPDF